MESSVPLSTFDTAYETDSAPWVISEPQPAIADLAAQGRIRGTVLDPGCGSGDNAIHLTRLGYDVHGVDFSSRALEQARANASEQGVQPRFEVADALHLTGGQQFDTVIDSALFHVFSPADRVDYLRSLHRVCRPGAVLHVLALADTEPGFGPRISESAVREPFTSAEWTLEDLRPSRYRGVAGEQDSAQLGVTPGTKVDLAAWLARARRD